MVVDRQGDVNATVELLKIGSSQLRVEVLPFGATLVGCWLSDGSGGVTNVVLRFGDLAEYRDRARNPYLGSTVGRYANRIGGARFTIDGAVHELDSNEGATCLHGGPVGWSFREWSVLRQSAQSVVLRMISPDGDQGFPGEVTATVGYRVEGSTLHVDGSAVSDAPTPISMTTHAYWNLAGTGAVDAHHLRTTASRVLEIDASLVPTGRVVRATSGPLALGSDVPIGERRFDHCYWWDQDPRAAVLSDPASGRAMTIVTDQPSIQVYTGDHLGAPFGSRSGICLEPQQLPDAPNHRGFPPVIVRPGLTYRHRTSYEFSLRRGLLSG